MRRFSANLGFLFMHLPLMERIGAAAAAGFTAVEMHWPYDVPAHATSKPRWRAAKSRCSP